MKPSWSKTPSRSKLRDETVQSMTHYNLPQSIAEQLDRPLRVQAVTEDGSSELQDAMLTLVRSRGHATRLQIEYTNSRGKRGKRYTEAAEGLEGVFTMIEEGNTARLTVARYGAVIVTSLEPPREYELLED